MEARVDDALPDDVIDVQQIVELLLMSKRSATGSLLSNGRYTRFNRIVLIYQSLATNQARTERSRVGMYWKETS